MRSMKDKVEKVVSRDAGDKTLMPRFENLKRIWGIGGALSVSVAALLVTGELRTVFTIVVLLFFCVYDTQENRLDV